MPSSPPVYLTRIPDDESFGVAGIARMYADRGAEIALVTATRGDAGRAGSRRCAIEPICRPGVRPNCSRRRGILGIGHVTVLDYLDKHLAEAPSGEIRRELVEAIRRHRPQVVDDVRSRRRQPASGPRRDFAVRERRSRGGWQTSRWYPDAGECASRCSACVWTSPVLPWDATKSPDLASRAGRGFPRSTSRRTAKQRPLRLRAHRTQHVSIDRHFFHLPDVDRILSVETFRQAFGPPLSKRPIDRSLEAIDRR